MTITNRRKLLLSHVGLPVFIVVTFCSGILLTILVGSQHHFNVRLNSLIGPDYDGLAEYSQSNLIFSYLLNHPSQAEPDFWFHRSQMLIKMDRKDEARSALQKALTVEMRRLNDTPNDPKVMAKMAKIYSQLGNVSLSQQYWSEALAEYEAELLDTVIREDEKVPVSSRPAWTYWIWSATGKTDKRVPLYIARAEIFEAMGNLEQSAVEYLSASVLSIDAKYQNKIMWDLGRVLYECGSRETMANDSLTMIPWLTIQSLYKKVKSQNLKLCNQ